MIQVYCGNGKGKTTAAVGGAIRAAGSSMRVAFAQFLKNGDSSELTVLQGLPDVTCILSPVAFPLLQMPDEALQARLRAAYDEMLRQVETSDAAFCVLDEVLDAWQYPLLSRPRLQTFLETQREARELVLTGRQLPPALAGLADYISEVQAVRHPFTKGIPARKGVEY